MAIQHKDIQEANLHEPKGVSLAAANTVYVATGAGTGQWISLDTNMLSGLGPQGGVSGLILVSNGSGGFRYIPGAAYASNAIINNANAFAVTAAADSSLNTTTDYTILTGTGAPWTPELSFGATPDTNGIAVVTTGVYRIEASLDIVSYPSATAKIGLRYLINTGGYSLRKSISKSTDAGDADNLSLFGTAALNAGDVVRIVIASTVTGGVIFENGVLSLTLMRAT